MSIRAEDELLRGAGAPNTIEPFRVEVPEHELADLRARILAARLPERSVSDAADVSVTTLRRWLAWWLDFDWRRHEHRLNAVPNFVTEIDVARIHFVHQRSHEVDALPLLLLNGWPSSVYHWLDVYEPLTGPGPDAFHIVAATLPGFTLSGPFTGHGWHPRRIAGAMQALMARLGYNRYGVEGSDFGSMVAMNLADSDRQHVVGVHLSTAPTARSPERVEAALPPRGVQATQLTPKQRARLDGDAETWRRSAAARAAHVAIPQTVGYGLDDSPAALLAWWLGAIPAGGLGAPDERLRNRILSDATLYWTTRTAASSLRLYRETQMAGRAAFPAERSPVPVGVTVREDDVSHPERPWVEAVHNVTYWREGLAGGHFAAHEVPVSFVNELRDFFRTLR